MPRCAWLRMTFRLGAGFSSDGVPCFRTARSVLLDRRLQAAVVVVPRGVVGHTDVDVLGTGGEPLRRVGVMSRAVQDTSHRHGARKRAHTLVFTGRGARAEANACVPEIGGVVC